MVYSNSIWLSLLFGETVYTLSSTVTEILPTNTDEALIKSASSGDHNAFRELVDRHQNAIIKTVTGMLGPSSEVDDVVQEAFIRFYKNLGRFRGNSTCRTYLTRIAINASLDALRCRKRSLSRFLSRDDPSLNLPEPEIHDSEPERFERRQLIHSAMNQLKPHHRSVIVLRLIDGYSSIETAEILGIAHGTVLSRLNRATAQLRRILHPLLEEEHLHNIY